MSKIWWKSRTIVLNLLSALAAATTLALPTLLAFQWNLVVDVKWAALIVLALNLANIGLRAVTTEPVSLKAGE